MLHTLHNKLSGFLDGKLFEVIFGLTVFMNPIGVWAQVYKLTVSATVAGLSMTTFSVFGAVQFILLLYGIKQEDWRIVLAMLLSIVGSVYIIASILTGAPIVRA